MTARSVRFRYCFPSDGFPCTLRYVLRLASVRYELYGTLLVCCVRAEASRELSVSDSLPLLCVEQNMLVVSSRLGARQVVRCNG